MTTSTFSPSAEAGNYSQGSGTSAIWASVRAAAGTPVNNTGAMSASSNWTYNAKGGTYTATIYRMVLEFDTSAIPDGDTIESVSLRLFAGGAGTITFQEATGTGYQSFTGSSIASQALIAGTTTFSLPTSCIKKDAATKLFLRGLADYNNSAANSGANSIATQQNTMVGYRPLLTVVHSEQTASGIIVPVLGSGIINARTVVRGF
jgi:hypothetical protein